MDVLQKATDFLVTRRQAYVRVFNGVYSDRVLRDLAGFCRANTSTFHTDPRLEGVLQGRREVWLRITAHLNMTDDELWSHFNSTGE